MFIFMKCSQITLFWQNNFQYNEKKEADKKFEKYNANVQWQFVFKLCTFHKVDYKRTELYIQKRTPLYACRWEKYPRANNTSYDHGNTID